MSKIIIPGEEKKKQELSALPPEEIILEMYRDAKERGMDFREYLTLQLKNWNPEDYIRETYESFLEAVQNGDEKPFPNENGRYWNEKSTFEEWLWYCEQVLLQRLDKLAEEKKTRPPSFEKLGQLREELGDHSDQLQLVVENAGEPQPLWVYEFYEEVMRKSLEAINNYKKGLLKLPPNYSWGDIDYPEKEIVEQVTQQDINTIKNNLVQKISE